MLTLLLLYVDDVYITRDNDALVAEIQACIQLNFELSDFGLLSYSLGIEFSFTYPAS